MTKQKENGKKKITKEKSDRTQDTQCEYGGAPIFGIYFWGQTGWKYHKVSSDPRNHLLFPAGNLLLTPNSGVLSVNTVPTALQVILRHGHNFFRLWSLIHGSRGLYIQQQEIMKIKLDWIIPGPTAVVLKVWFPYQQHQYHLDPVRHTNSRPPDLLEQKHPQGPIF